MTRVVAFTPPHVTRFAAAAGLTLDQVRWCHAAGCRTVAYAIDAYQREQLARHGFDRNCPEHADHDPLAALDTIGRRAA
jgi:hypothetical protein